MQKSHRIWLAVPPDEKDEAINAHPRLDNGQKAIGWDKEHRLWYARPGTELNKFERWLPRPHELSMNAGDPVTEFAQKLEEAGLVLNGLPVMDGSVQRVPTKQDKKGSKSGVYKGYMDGRPAGWYRDYRGADEKPTQWVFSGGQEMDPQARLHLRAQAQQTREDNARELMQQYSRQAEYATRYVSRLEQATTNAYLTRKGVDAAPGVRINDKQELVIPFSNAQGQIRSYQRIPLTGGKDARILKDSEKTGNWFALGTPQNGQPVLFAEGYATAASLHEATGLPVLMTIDAGNMIAASQNARAVWPDSPFIFCADNDHQLKNPQTGEPENKGILSAQKAADLTGGTVITPDFTAEEKSNSLTDFNDLDVSRGREAFREVVSASLQSAGIDIRVNSPAPAPDGAPSLPQQVNHMDNQENPVVSPVSENERGLQAMNDFALHLNQRMSTAELLRNVDADPAYRGGLLAAMAERGLEMEARGYPINHATYALSELQNMRNEVMAQVQPAPAVPAESAAPAPTNGPALSAEPAAPAAANTPDVTAEPVTPAAPVAPTVSQASENERGLQAMRDFTLHLNQRMSTAELLRNVDADPAYRGGLLAALAERGLEMEARGYPINHATYALSELQNMRNEVMAQVQPAPAVPAESAAPAPTNGPALSADAAPAAANTPDVTAEPVTPAAPVAPTVSQASENERGLQAMRDFALHLNQRMSTAELLRNVDADPAYRGGLLAALAERGLEMEARGYPINHATYALSELQNMRNEVMAQVQPAPAVPAEPAAPAPTNGPALSVESVTPAAPVAPTVSQASENERGLQAMRDFTLHLNQRMSTAELLRNVDADPAYRGGLLAALAERGLEMEARGYPINHATYALSELQNMRNEVMSQTQPTPDVLTQMFDEVRRDEALLMKDAEKDIKPFEPEYDPAPQGPAPAQSGHQAEATQSAQAQEPVPEPSVATGKAAEASGPETDGIVYGPRRPEPQPREDLDKIIKSLSTEELRDNTVLYRLDGQDAFRDLGNRLEMTNGASQNKQMVLAALAVASRFYGGVVELTGSPEFKEHAMRLIVENDLDIRMKLPAQRAQLDELRKQMGVTHDAVATHIPTPDLNRHTPSPDAAPPVSPAPAAQTTTPATDSPAPAAPVVPGVSSPVPQVPSVNVPEPAAPVTAQPAAAQPGTSTPADSIKVSEEPAPSALKPGESVTAVLTNFGEAKYENKEKSGNSFFIELQNRGGSHTYWGQDLRELVADHKPGDVVRLTLNSRDSWHVPGEEHDRVKNNWSLTGASTGIAVAHNRPEQGQALQAFPVDTFGQLTMQISQTWPQYTADLKLPPRLEERQFWLGEDRHPVKAPQNAESITPPSGGVPPRLTPVMASMDSQSDQLNLLLVQSAGNHLQGMVRLDGTLYPALATPTADNRQLVINAITDEGPRFAGYGQAVNFEPDGTTRAAPQLMTFHLKGREEETPLPARLYTPDKQADAVFQNLGFEQTWKQWDDARKPEDRQEKVLHQEHSHSPGR